MAGLVFFGILMALISGQTSICSSRVNFSSTRNARSSNRTSSTTPPGISPTAPSVMSDATKSLARPNIQMLNVSKVLAQIKLRPAKASENHGYNLTGQGGKIKLNVVHKDKIFLNDDSYDYNIHFEVRMKRDLKRVAALVHRLNHYECDVNDFATGTFYGEELGIAEYLVIIGVGTPPTSHYMVIDTGSDITWIQCHPCEKCYLQAEPVFDPTTSTTSTSISCESPICNLLMDSGCSKGQCQYRYTYGDGSRTEGAFILEHITIGSMITTIAIGCGHRNQGTFTGVSGILALGETPLSLVGQLAGPTGGLFSYCLPGFHADSPGSLEFGRQAIPEGATWVPLIQNLQYGPYYNVDLRGIGVGGQLVPIPENVFYGKVILDTGTAVTRFPTKAYNVFRDAFRVAFRDAFIAQTQQLPRATSKSLFDTCYDLSEYASIQIPTVSFYFSSGAILSFVAKNFLVPVDDAGTFCLAFAAPGTLVDSGFSIIGNVQQEGFQVAIDVANGFVGIGPNIC